MSELLRFSSPEEQKEATAQLSEVIRKSRNIVFFGGAGVSTGSGIPDFRSASGLYQSGNWGGESPEYHLSHECLTREPAVFFDYYRKNMLYPDAEPNGAHRALARLEAEGKLSAVITQNIDGLHQMAGSRNVVELHGSILRNYCLACGRKYPLSAVSQSCGIPVCPVCGGMIRPDVVMYGEALPEDALRLALKAVQNADVMIVGGTSLRVYPAASLVDYFRGRELIFINLSPTPYDVDASLILRAPIEKILPAAVEGSL